MHKHSFLLLLSIFLYAVPIQAQELDSVQHQDTISGKNVFTSIFAETQITKSYFYKSLWGPRYRDAYATLIKAPIVDLNTYKQGFKNIQQYGAVNSGTFLLKDNQDATYIVRALRKNPTAYLNNEILKQEYRQGKLDDTYTAEFIDDLGTGAHPYISLVVSSLARDLDITHTYSSLIYVPKDGGLRGLQGDYGDELFYIEKQIPSEILKTENTSLKDTVVSTAYVLEQLRADRFNKIDETAYIQSRIFDMLIGDWNRGEPQWDWLPQHNEGNTTYVPISKNSDQAFSKMGDGPLMKLATLASRKKRHLASYDGLLKDPKWFNFSAFALDKALISNLDARFWDEETKKITAALTDEVITKAFGRVPSDLKAKISEEIIVQLKQRRAQLPQLVSSYVALLKKLIIIKGTDTNDNFVIERKLDGSTEITIQQKEGANVPAYKQTITSGDTRHVWLYGLDGDDTFEVKGTGEKPVPIYIFGGENNDDYTIQNADKVRIYDFTAQGNNVTPSTIKVRVIDEPEAGAYTYKKTERFVNRARPILGVNVDDGLRIGLENTLTDFGFQHLPFSQQHVLGASFYFSTSGFEIHYAGQWTHVFDKLNLGMEAEITSPNYTRNFFGFGNETVNLNEEDPDNVRISFNRVRVQKFRLAPSVSYQDPSGYSLKGSLAYSSIDIEATENRFIETFFANTNNETQNNFAEISATAAYTDDVQDIIPFLDVDASVTLGNSFNITATSNAIYLNPKLTIGLPFDKGERVKLVSNIASYINFNDDIQFYQGSILGAESGLRGYRNQRFTGINSFVQSTDLRVKLNRVQTRLIPLDLGVYGGFDYGRVWIDNDLSNDIKTSVGGGLFFNTSGVLVGNLSAFNSEEGLRVALKLGAEF